VRVLHGAANREEQFQPLGRGQSAVVAIDGDGCTVDVVHYKERPPPRRRARIQNACDVGMFHQREAPAFVIESRQHLARIHAQLYHFESYATADGFTLFGKVDSSHAALAEDSQEPVWSEAVMLGGLGHLHCFGLRARFAGRQISSDRAGQQARRTQTRGISRFQPGAALGTGLHHTRMFP
jgi:hypothetical protein